LRQQRWIGERLRHNAFAKFRDKFRDFAHAIFILRAQEERPQERAMYPVAERELFGTHPRV
jgi:hypothetical protein